MNMTVLQRLYKSFRTFLRFLQLVAIFSPSVLLLPLYFFRWTEDIWFTLFVRTIERAGVVWIKSFQYLSHRRDIIGEKMAMRFMHLREQAPGHKFEDTAKTFQAEFGKDVNEIFEKFNPVPIASGSISQVYEAQYKG
jgi:predicted unusual protein kinase regulating ubiquinone biosynthesis (AarF/ABC1/UbiB family)